MSGKNCLSLMSIVLILMPSLLTIAQDSIHTINKVNIASPTAASLGKYGDIPVNYNTGIPNINIPIYTIKSKDLTLPISLSYHASGLKVQEQASWVGAGWSLSGAGGMITRAVVGLPDDKGSGPTMFTHGHYSEYGYNNYLFIPGSGPDQASDGTKPGDENFVKGYRDGEPDMFTFNFNNITGKFYFNDDRTPVIVPEQDLKIETDFVMGSGFLGFVVTTSEGTKYYFGRTGNNSSINPIETTVPYTFESGPAFTQKAASSWFLNKIVSADATDSILLSYQAENYGYYTVSMFPISNYQSPSFGAPAQYGHNLVKNLVDGVRLTQISFPNGSVTFTPSATPRTDLVKGHPTIIDDGQPNTTSYSLGAIQISNGSGFCKKFVFDYSYFYDNVNPKRGPILTQSSFTNINTDRYKLKLDTIQEMSCDGSVQIPPYVFNYYTELVPRSLSFGIDHWGYYNGVTNNSSGLIPAHRVKFQGLVEDKTGANRESAWPAMRGGALQKITYPTGGYNIFDYEPNSVFLNYNTYTAIQRFSRSVGYDGNSTPSSAPFTFTTNAYKLIWQCAPCNTMSCSNTSVWAFVEILNSSNNVVFNSGSAFGGESKEVKIQLAAGNYTVRLTRMNASSGSGAYCSLTETVPTPVSGNQIVGGLRIKAITVNDAITANDIVTNFNYDVSTNHSSGILYSKPEYVKVVKNRIVDRTWPVPQGSYCTILLGSGNPGLSAYVSEQYFKSPVSVRPMQTVQGYHIGYNEVKVTQTGNGFSVYRYYGSNYWDNQLTDVCNRLVDFDNVCDYTVPETPSVPVEFEFMRGQLKYEGHYNETGQIVKDKWNYPRFSENALFTPGHISTEANGWGLYNDYNLRSQKKILDSVQETTYGPSLNGNITVIKVTYYGSGFHTQPTQKVFYSSAGERLTTNLKYAFDLLPSTCLSVNDGLTTYLNAIHADSLIYFDTLPKCTPQAPANPLSSCRYKQLSQFRRNINLDRIAYINTRKTSFTNTTNAYKTAHDNAKSAALAQYKPILEMQDLYMNPVVEQSIMRENLLVRSGYTKFDYSINPATKVYPVLFQALNLATPTAGFTSVVVNGGNTDLVKDSRYKDEKTFKFYLGNLVEIVEKDGITNSYIWGLNNSVPIVKAIGIDHATLLAAYNAVSGDLNTLRNQASLNAAMLSTYTYAPIIGMLSETNENKRKTAYEYDALGRLQNIKDHNANVLKTIDYKYQSNTNQ